MKKITSDDFVGPSYRSVGRLAGVVKRMPLAVGEVTEVTDGYGVQYYRVVKVKRSYELRTHVEFERCWPSDKSWSWWRRLVVWIGLSRTRR